MRLGVLSDLHCELEPSGSRWINPYEPEQLDKRIDAALEWFAELAGQPHRPAGRLRPVCEPRRPRPRVRAARRVCAGSARDGERQSRPPPGGGVRAASERTWHSAALRGAPRAGGRGRDGCRGRSRASAAAVRRRVGAAGQTPISSSLRRTFRFCPRRPEWAGGRTAVRRRPGEPSRPRGTRSGLTGRPKLVLCGHIHARCSRQDGPLLQLMVRSHDRAAVRRGDRRDRHDGRPANDPDASARSR